MHPERGEHVVEKPHARGDVDHAAAVELQLHSNLGLAGGALDLGSARGLRHTPCSLLSAGWGSAGSDSAAASPADSCRMRAQAARKASPSSRVPIVTRRYPGMPTSRSSTPASTNRRHTAGASANLPNSRKLAAEG